MSYCIYVGKNLSADGSAYLAGYGDEPSSHWLEIVPARTHPPDATLTVGVTEKADYPGQLIQIPQVAQTAKYIGVNYSYYKGVPAPLINGGLNQHHVAVRDVWSPSRPELQQMTPKTQTGANYSNLARIVLERATSARHAVEVVGDLIAQHGYATYGGNSHLFADCNEAWVVIEFAGGQGLWVAERVGPDDIRASRPGYIGNIPPNFNEHPHYRGAANLISFAVAQGWYDPAGGEPFNVNKVYGDGKMAWPAVRWIEQELRTRANSPRKVGLPDMIWAVRTPRLTGETAGYGQVVPLRQGQHTELGLLWHAPAPAVTAPFTPFFLGVTDVPPEFKKHRYLTANESALFIDPRASRPAQQSQLSGGIESTQFAFRLCKRLFYLTMQHHEKFLPEVTEALTAFETALAKQLDVVAETAHTLYEAEKSVLARQFLTYFSNTEALNALRLVTALSASLEARTKLLYGIDDAPGSQAPELFW